MSHLLMTTTHLRTQKKTSMSKRSTNLLALILLCLTAGYGFFQARTLMRGPILTINSPKGGELIEQELFEVTGTTENVTHVFLNGRPVPLTTKGTFTETLVTPDGYGVLLVEAENRFGHHRQERIEIFGAPAQEHREITS